MYPFPPTLAMVDPHIDQRMERRIQQYTAATAALVSLITVVIGLIVLDGLSFSVVFPPLVVLVVVVATTLPGRRAGLQRLWAGAPLLSFPAYTSATVQVQGASEEILQRAAQAIRALGDRAAIRWVDPVSWTVHGEAGATWSGWGELVSVRIWQGQQPGMFLAEVASANVVSSNRFDMTGRNRRNVQTIAAYLTGSHSAM